jgi:DNA-binding transcriptional MerR regulator
MRASGKKGTAAMDYGDLNADGLSISEFSRIAGINPASLRHYDNLGIFSPEWRGEATNNKYRYYSLTQVTTVKMPRVLAEIGVPLKTIKELSQTRSPATLLKLLGQSRDRILGEMRSQQNNVEVISVTMELLVEAMGATESELSVREMQEKRIILGDRTDFSGEAGFTREFLRFCSGSYDPPLSIS